MILTFINRPIAVLVTFAVLLILGFVSLCYLPVSLLPNIDVPRIIVKVYYPNTAAPIIDENIIRPIRESFISLDDLDDIETVSSNHMGTLSLKFRYGTRMDLAYIKVHERLDRLTGTLPKDLPRPQVVRANISDIPAMRIQVIPKSKDAFLQVSALTEKVLRKRIEQIRGVSVVDINGKRHEVVCIEPIRDRLAAFSIDEGVIVNAIKEANIELGSLSVIDGQYRYFITLSNRLRTIQDLRSVVVKLNSREGIKLSDIANIDIRPDILTGYHVYDGRDALVVTVHKHPDSRMHEVIPEVKKLVSAFKRDYPQIDFAVTQDQSFLLDAAINNLNQDLVYGAILCVTLLFLLLGHYGPPIIMSIVIPASLIISFIFFYAFNISLNIISLSGLALGIGMVVDNSIVVIDSITRKRITGLSINESCVYGVQEVLPTVLSQVLTTVVVYTPLIYLGGLAGAIIYDQAIALTISLAVSLAIAVCLNPVLYKLFLAATPTRLDQQTFCYRHIARGYSIMMNKVYSRKRTYLWFTVALMPIGFLLLPFIPISALPAIPHNESILRIDWNEPLNIAENRRRVLKMMSIGSSENIAEWEGDIGISQFVFEHERTTTQKASIYLKFKSEQARIEGERILVEWLREFYPLVSSSVEAAPNAFTQLFVDTTPYFEARFRSSSSNLNSDGVTGILEEIAPTDFEYGVGFLNEKIIELTLDHDRLALYNVSITSLRSTLERTFGTQSIADINDVGKVTHIKIINTASDFRKKLAGSVINDSGIGYPLKEFVKTAYADDPKFLTADKSGPYRSVSFKEGMNFQDIKEHLNYQAVRAGIMVDFSGRYFSERSLMFDMLMIFSLCILLLFFILAIQFESLITPLLVMLAMPFGASASLLTLYLSGGTLDIMAAIGLIVVLGIIVDDPILKIDVVKRLVKKYKDEGETDKDAIVEKALHEAGEICLKPLLMTSLTTSLAVLPILFTPGIGADLQKPLVWVIVGGLTFGTFLTLWFIPLAYMSVFKRKSRNS